MENTRKLDHIVICVPGLITSEEHSRTEQVGIENTLLLRTNYSGVQRDGNTITCNFSMPESLEDFQRTLEKAISYKSESSRLGVIASSMGAAVFNHFIATHAPEIDWVVYTSPFAKINPGMTGYLKGQIQNHQDLEITSSYDKERGWRRVIPFQRLSEILDINCAEKLKDRKPSFRVSTLLGEKDTIIDTGAALTCHRILGGNEKTLFTYQSDHYLPYDQSSRDIAGFLTQSKPQ